LEKDSESQPHCDCDSEEPGYAILDYLSFREPASNVTPSWIHWENSAWLRVFRFLDSAGLTLLFREKCQRRNHWSLVPVAVRARLDQNFKDNLSRTELLREEFLRVNRHLQSLGVRYINLKGLLLYPHFTDRPEHRVQYDFDFLVPSKELHTSYLSLQGMGYSPTHSKRKQRADHLPPLIKKTGWEWKGNLFDPAIPPGIELHFQLWDSEFERISTRLFVDVWEAAVTRNIDSMQVPYLSRNHELLYLVLHCCRHLFRCDLRLSHLYELSYFLHLTSLDREQWGKFLSWLGRCRNSPKLAATVFALSASLFRPTLDSSLRAWIHASLPSNSKRWIGHYARRDAIHGYRANKNTLLLHLSLVDKRMDRWAVLRRRVFPSHLPLPTYGVHIPDSGKRFRVKVLAAGRYAGFLLKRMIYHVLSSYRFLIQLALWVRFRQDSSEPEL
jgi:hypothetical protein